MKNNKTYIPQNGVTIITEIDPSGDIRHLYELLNSIGRDILNQKVIDFGSVTTLHFVRWFIIEGATDASGKEFPDSLAFSSDFDGDIDSHLHEMFAVAGGGMDQIYSYCKGYPGKGRKSPGDAVSYLKKHIQKNQLFWPCIRGGTLEQLKGEEKLRYAIQAFIAEESKKCSFDKLQPEEIRTRIRHFVAGNPDLSWALEKSAKPGLDWQFRYYGKLVLRITTLLLLLPLIILFFIPVWWLLLSRIFEKKDQRDRKEIIRPEGIDDLLQREDHLFMNQFTIYGAIKKPYWYRLTTLKMGLWLFATNGTYRANKGKLSGIETIHFARWCIFNKGKNVMFLSNYDGAWEIYLSQFIDRSAAAMNLTFGTTVGYPAVRYLFWGGAFDEQAFKTVVRNNQYPTQVFYSAYPYSTAKNQLNNAAIRKGLNGQSKESCTEWLKRL